MTRTVSKGHGCPRLKNKLLTSEKLQCKLLMPSWTRTETDLIVLGFNDMSTLVNHFVSSPREREKRDSRGDERQGQGRKRKRSESEETEEIIDTF